MHSPKKQRPAGKGGSRKQKSFGRLEETSKYNRWDYFSRVEIGSMAIGAIADVGGDVWVAWGPDCAELGYFETLEDAHAAVWADHIGDPALALSLTPCASSAAN